MAFFNIHQTQEVQNNNLYVVDVENTAVGIVEIECPFEFDAFYCTWLTKENTDGNNSRNYSYDKRYNNAKSSVFVNTGNAYFMTVGATNDLVNVIDNKHVTVNMTATRDTAHLTFVKFDEIVTITELNPQKE